LGPSAQLWEGKDERKRTEHGKKTGSKKQRKRSRFSNRQACQKHTLNLAKEKRSEMQHIAGQPTVSDNLSKWQYAEGKSCKERGWNCGDVNGGNKIGKDEDKGSHRRREAAHPPPPHTRKDAVVKRTAPGSMQCK